MGLIQELRETIKYLHRVESTHVKSVYVKEVLDRKTIWEGVVEVFDLHGHTRCNRLYALRHNLGGTNERHVTVLHLEPISSPETAVKAAIARDFRNLQTR